jgi:hypothetical protein
VRFIVHPDSSSEHPSGESESMTTSQLTTRRAHPFGWVLAGGALAGTLDISYACVFWKLKADVPALRIFQSVAAGLLGKNSFDGGARTAALGLLLHYGIAITMAVVYFAVARRWALLRDLPWPCGAAFGILAYLVMNYVVVPLSAAGAGSKDPLWVTLSVVAHVLLIGIPIALASRRALQW